LGCDTWLDLSTYDFGSKTKERLRHASNWLGKYGFEVREGSFIEDVKVEKIRALSAAWFTSRRSRKAVYF